MLVVVVVAAVELQIVEEQIETYVRKRKKMKKRKKMDNVLVDFNGRPLLPFIKQVVLSRNDILHPKHNQNLHRMSFYAYHEA